MLTVIDSSRAGVWPSSWRASSGPTMCSTASRICSLPNGPPEHIRSDNGPEFVPATCAVARPDRRQDTLHRAWQPWENGYCESFDSKLRDELLAGEQFSTLFEAQVLIERWRRHYNTVRPHSSRSAIATAPEVILPPASTPAYAALRPAQTLATSGRILT